MSNIDRYSYDSETKILDSKGHYAQNDLAGYKGCEIAHGFISTTEILFVRENLIARIEANGRVDFLNPEEKLLASACVSTDGDGHGKYEAAYCNVDGDTIKIRFPIYEWYDNYPNCDGEHDRWDCRVVGYTKPIAYALSTGEAFVAEE